MPPEAVGRSGAGLVRKSLGAGPRGAPVWAAMDDLALVDWVERLRAWGGAAGGGLGARAAELRRADWRRRGAGWLRERAVAVAAGGGERRETATAADGAARSRRISEETERAEAGAGPWAGLAAALDDGFGARLSSSAGAAEAARLVAAAHPALRGRRAWEFLAEAGYPAAAETAGAARFLRRLGWPLPEGGPCGGGAALRRAYGSALERAARAAGGTVGELALLVSAYAGAPRAPGVAAVCVERPACAACAFSPACAYAAMGGPAARTASVPAAAGATAEAVPTPAAADAGYIAIKNWSVGERPRERLLSGERLTDAELLALVLRTGGAGRSAVDLARTLLSTFGGPARLAAASPSDLATVKGVGPAKAAEIVAALELGRRAALPEADERDGRRAIGRSADVFAMFRARWMTATQEEFALLALDKRNRVVRETMVARGTLDRVIVHPRDVFAAALRDGAAGVIIAHNHPSGDPAPSPEDRDLTRRLAESGRMLGVPVLDHIVVGATRFYSFRDMGEL